MNPNEWAAVASTVGTDDLVDAWIPISWHINQDHRFPEKQIALQNGMNGHDRVWTTQVLLDLFKLCFY